MDSKGQTFYCSVCEKQHPEGEDRCSEVTLAERLRQVENKRLVRKEILDNLK